MNNIRLNLTLLFSSNFLKTHLFSNSLDNTLSKQSRVIITPVDFIFQLDVNVYTFVLTIVTFQLEIRHTLL